MSPDDVGGRTDSENSEDSEDREDSGRREDSERGDEPEHLDVDVADVDIEDVDIEDVDIEDVDIEDVDIEDVDIEDVDFGDDEAVWGDRRWRAAALRQLPLYLQVFRGPQHVNVGETEAVVALYGGQHGVGQRIAHYLTGAEGQGLIEMLDRVYAGERLVARAVRFGVVTPGGSQREVFSDIEFLPLRDASGAIAGTIAFGTDVTDAVRAEREQAAAAAELSRRYRRATDVIEEVQRALLPARLPVLPAVEVAASYVVGGAEQAAGGDWFDVLPRPGGSVAAVVGDVVGHGVAASAVMSQLRAVALERLHAGAGPGEVVRTLDRFVEVVPEGRSATICVLDLQPDARSFTWCAAGHPPPLVVDLDGSSRFLDPSGAPPLGHHTGYAAGHTAGRTVQTGTLGPEELVLLYTDGIVERPGVPATAGTVELARAAATAAADRFMPVFTLPSAADRVTTQTLERLTRLTGSTDDITLLALQPTAPLSDLHLEASSTQADVPQLRSGLRRWLGTERAAPLALQQLDQIVTELCENVIEHAYNDRVEDGAAGQVLLDAALDELGWLTLRVADRGRWRLRAGPCPGRGLGLAIVEDLSDRVEVDPSPAGTTVTVRFRPWKSPHSAQAQRPRAVEELFDVYTEHRTDRSILTVRGPVDAENVLELDAELALSVTSGAPPLTVDLEHVTLLSSAALHAVLRRLDQARLAGVDVHLASSPGTVAQQVLALIGLDTHLPPT
ncbi:SpoIIE family protein phosphatase [Vallicoccus soli]|uniref:SpoIIE family protein phosphatase n=1 Tax=Vallicoccus soli TaxID=2339232 RepID=UPI00140319BC|nr:SpoIIE family protein phosphatase [Vallicoccus soli]